MNKSKKKAALGRYIWLLPLAALLFLCGVAGLYTYRYQQRFLPGTTIAGVDCANMTALEAAQALKEAVSVTKITLGDSSGELVAEIPVTASVDEGKLDDAALNAFNSQKENAGLFDWLLPGQHPCPAAFFRSVTEEQAAQVLEAAV